MARLQRGIGQGARRLGIGRQGGPNQGPLKVDSGIGFRIWALCAEGMCGTHGSIEAVVYESERIWDILYTSMLSSLIMFCCKWRKQTRNTKNM